MFKNCVYGSINGNLQGISDMMTSKGFWVNLDRNTHPLLPDLIDSFVSDINPINITFALNC